MEGDAHYATPLLFREIYKAYYEKQLAQVEERPAGLKSRNNVDEDVESARLHTVSFIFSIRETTYDIQSHSYIPTDVISRHYNTIEPLYSKDSTVSIQHAIQGHPRLQLAS